MARARSRGEQNDSSSTRRTIGFALVVAIVALTAAAESQANGRYKTGDACVRDANGSGDDQFRTASGRFKKQCTLGEWDAKDSGPEQCDPRKAAK
jgi:hypothetical protein